MRFHRQKLPYFSFLFINSEFLPGVPRTGLRPFTSDTKASRSHFERKSGSPPPVSCDVGYLVLSPQSEFDALRVVLVNTRNPLNIGAAARAMSNFGFLHLRVVNPFELAFRQARSAVGAAPLLAEAEEFQSLEEALADCSLVVGTTALSRRDPQHTVRDVRQGARLIRKRLSLGCVALLFGSEKRGLSNAHFSHCHWLLRIPTGEQHRSMNLGQAVAVCLYELARDPQAVSKQENISPPRPQISSVLLGSCSTPFAPAAI